MMNIKNKQLLFFFNKPNLKFDIKKIIQSEKCVAKFSKYLLFFVLTSSRIKSHMISILLPSKFNLTGRFLPL